MSVTHRSRLAKCLVLLLALLSFRMTLHGQEADHVYLKNGTILRGQISELEPMGHVTIRDLCGNSWRHPMTEVEKITSEPFDFEKDHPPQYGYSAGYVNMTSLGFLAGSSGNMQVAPFSLVMVNGWRSAFGLFTGLGAGVEFLSATYMPLFADLRFDITGTDVVPFLIARGGYSLPLGSGQDPYDIETSYGGGPMAATGLGLKIRTREHFAWEVALMYRYQETSYEEVYTWNDQQYEYTDIYNRIEIRLGFYID